MKLKTLLFVLTLVNYWTSTSRETFTQWNGRADSDCLFKRLDRILMNQECIGMAGHVEVEHLARTGSDHAPLLLSCSGKQLHITKSFKFLKFWVEEADFKEV